MYDSPFAEMPPLSKIKSPLPENSQLIRFLSVYGNSHMPPKSAVFSSIAATTLLKATSSANELAKVTVELT